MAVFVVSSEDRFLGLKETRGSLCVDVGEITPNMAPAKSLVVRSVCSPLNLKVEVEPIPVPHPGSAVVNILAAGIGPHYKQLLSTPNPHLKFPTPSVFGNHGVGRVVALGPDSTSLAEGQLVFVDSFVTSRDDPEVSMLLGLMDGGTRKSRKLANNIWRDGCWTSHAVVPLENVTPLSEDVLVNRLGCDIADLPYLNRLSVAYGAVSAVGLKAGETVVVGPASGQFGGAAVEVASAMGARVIAIGRNKAALARLKTHIARVEVVVLTDDSAQDTKAIKSFGPVDAFIDFSPAGPRSPAHIPSAIRSLRRFGRVALMGGFAGDIAIPYAHLMMNGIELKGRWMYSRQELTEVVRMVEIGLLKIGKVAGHKAAMEFALEEWEAALDVAAKHAAWGEQVLFTP